VEEEKDPSSRELTPWSIGNTSHVEKNLETLHICLVEEVEEEKRTLLS
jgi:hypothetical protein